MNSVEQIDGYGRTKRSLCLTGRDVEVLEFLNEMGPMNLEPLIFRFWGQTNLETKIKNARIRINRLRDEGFLESLMFKKRSFYYRTTPFGVSALKWYRAGQCQLKATSQISFNTHHAILVAWVRIRLEQMGLAQFWRSERRLLSEDRPLQARALRGKMSIHIPDGVYQNIDGKMVIFELEHYPKTPAQRKTRISKIKGLLTYLPDHYQALHIVSTSQSILESYKALTQGLNSKVTFIEDLFDQGELKYVLK